MHFILLLVIVVLDYSGKYLNKWLKKEAVQQYLCGNIQRTAARRCGAADFSKGYFGGNFCQNTAKS